MADPTFQWPGIPVEPSTAPAPAPTPDLNVGMTPMPRLQLPSGGELNPNEINSLVGTAISMRKMQEENRAAAIRYQGQMEYQQLISQGADPADALRRTLHKLSFGSPTTFTATIADLQRAQREKDIQAYHQRHLGEIERHNRELERMNALKPPPLTPAQKQADALEKMRESHDYGAWMADYRRAQSAHAAADRNLNKFKSDAMTIATKGKDPAVEARQAELEAIKDDAKAEMDRLVAEGAKRGHLKAQPGSLPQTSERTIGMIATTPRGVFKWNGKGWDAVDSTEEGE